MNSGSEKSFGAFSILIDYMRDLANYSCYTAERFEETFLTKIPNYQDIIKIKNISIHEISIILNLFNNIYGIAYSNVERNYPSPKTIYMDGASIIANNYHVALAYSPKIFEYNSYVDVPADFKCSFEKAFSVYVHGPYEKNKYINPDNQTYYDQFYEKYYNIYSPGSKQFTLKSPDDILRK
jgi:hypothetical protein